MKLLLDTHVFLWYISADPQLPTVYRDAIRDPANEVYLSVGEAALARPSRPLFATTACCASDRHPAH
jgi:hypothetical protein